MQMVARTALDTLRLVTGTQEDLDTFFTILDWLGQDLEPVVRAELMEQVPHVAMYCQEVPEYLNHVVPNHLLPLVVKFLTDKNNQVRKTSQAALLVLLEQGLVEKTDVEKQVCPVIIKFTEADSLDDYRTEAVALLSKMAPMIGREMSERLFLERFATLCVDPLFHVRKVCAANFGDFSGVVGPESTEKILLPKFFFLCEDGVWGVRKACADVFMPVSCVCSPAVRQTELSPLFINLLRDQSRWVRMAAFQALGPFISTFADPAITALLHNENGEIIITDPDQLAARLNYLEETRALGASRAALNSPEDARWVSVSVVSARQALKYNYPQDSKDIMARAALNYLEELEASRADNKTESSSSSSRGDSSSNTGAHSSSSFPPSLENTINNNGEELTASQNSANNNVVPMDEREDDWSAQLVASSSPRSLEERRAGLYFEAARRNDNSDFSTFMYWREPVASLDLVDIDLDSAEAQDAEMEDVEEVREELNTLNLSETRSNGNPTDTSHNRQERTEDSAPSEEAETRPDLEDSSSIPEPTRDCTPREETKSESTKSSSSDSSSETSEPSSESASETSEPSSESSSETTKSSSESSSETTKSSSDSTSETTRSSSESTTELNETTSIQTGSEESVWTGIPVITFQKFDVLTGNQETSTMEMYRPGDKEAQENISTFDPQNRWGSYSSLHSSRSSLDSRCTEVHPPDPALPKGPPETDQSIVPQLLIDHYVSMIDPSRAQTVDNDIARHCAFSLPAVALTLGRSNWPLLKETYETLANDMQWKVRRTLASSIHELGVILGEEVAAQDLVPIFNGFIKDLDEVRIGILKHLADFLKLLKEKERKEYLPKLEEFLKMDNERNWRFRLELAEQMGLMVNLFSPLDVKTYLAPIALTLIQDKVSAVRTAATVVVSNMIETQDPNLNLYLLTELADKLAQSSFWSRRQTFGVLCGELVNRIPYSIFSQDLLPHLLLLSGDRVPNVRMQVGRVLGQQLPDDLYMDSNLPGREEIVSALTQLAADKDSDVREAATGMDRVKPNPPAPPPQEAETPKEDADEAGPPSWAQIAAK